MLNFSKKPTLIAYLTCGDPDLRSTRGIILSAIDAGADVIEIGVPFSDPVADGPVIQRASERALRHGTRLADVLEIASEVRKARPQAGLIIFSYLNPILRFGVQQFCEAALKAGIDGALVTDLTFEESEYYVAAMHARNLATVFLAAPTSTDQRLAAIAKHSSGFVYAVSRTGVTGARKDVTQDAKELVVRIRRFTQLPVALGFGISTPEQFGEVAQFADAVVVGSAIVEVIERNPRDAAEKVGDFIRSLKSAAVATPTAAC